MRNFSLVMAHFKNPGMLVRQYAHWAGLPAELRAQMQVVICDDASPKGFRPPLPPAAVGLPVELYRIKKKTAWNWMGARNIGAHHATGDWLLFTDMDHMLPKSTADFLVNGDLDPANVYRFSRVDAPHLTPYKPHPNSWFMRRDVFRRFVGFDERFAGSYGSDYDVRDRLAAASKAVVMLSHPLIRVPREVTSDASTTDFGRKNSAFSRNLPLARQRIAREGGPPLTLSFGYERLA